MAADAIPPTGHPGLRFDHASLREALETRSPTPSGSPSPSLVNGTDGENFSQAFVGAMLRANQMSVDAGRREQDLAAGLTDDIHGTMIASREANISVRLVGSIRNKLLDAFHELWRTSV